jgi:CRP-like cAMP-binding protein
MIGAHSNPLISKFDHLYPLTADEQSALEGAFSRVVYFEADEDVVREGERPSECNVLLEGMTIRYKILEDGQRQIFSFHIPGDIYDAQSFLLDEMDHSVATLTRCKVAVISHATMKDLTEAYPRIGRAIWKETLADAAIFREWMASIGRRLAYPRIAHLMCELVSKRFAVGLSNGHTRIEWPITQAEVGDALGLSLVHVNRTLKELREAGLITLDRSHLNILDWDGLQRAGQFDPRYLHLKPRAPGVAGNGHTTGPAH